MNEHNSLPNMRFKGFTDKWKQEKLGNIATVEMNKRIYKNQTNEKGEIPFYKIGTFGKKADSFISNKLFNEYKKKYPYPKVGDILISASGTIGNTIVYKGEDAYFQDSNIVWLNINHNIILNSFLYSFYQIVHWRGIEGSTIKRLYNSNILSTPINYPSVNEQQKIGNLFAKLDKLLDLQQQKIDKLELLKKALLQKLFPKHDAKIPELRFKGFEDVWRKHRLKEVSKIIGGGTPDTKNPKYWNGNINWFSPNEIGNSPYAVSSHKKITDLGLKKSSAKLHPAEKTILFTSRAGIGDMAILTKSAATNQGFQSLELNNNVDSYFVYSYGFEIKKKANRLASGSTFLEISKNEMEKITLMFPSEQEQQRIGNFLSKVDQLIELENKKLQNFQQVKKCLLQNMFVE